MPNKKKICIITPVHWSYSMGGIEYQVKLLSESLCQNRDIQLIYLSKKINKQYLPQNYHLLKISEESTFKRNNLFLDSVSLFRLLNRIRPDVIYENGGCSYTGVAALYAKKANCKMIWHIASDNDLENKRPLSNFKLNQIIEKKFLKIGIKNSKIIIAQTEYQKKLALRNNHSASVHLVRNFHPLPDIDEMVKKENQIVWVANFKKLKQPEIYLNVAEALERCHHNVQCLMIGAPASYPKHYQAELDQRIRNIKNLKYLGKLPIEQVNQIIAKSKLFINTSKWEGFPNTFIQAWMRKTPVLSLHCDPDHIIKRHKCGIVSGTEEKMTNDILFLLRDEKLREAMGQNAYSYALQSHSSQNLKHLEKIILK